MRSSRLVGLLAAVASMGLSASVVDSDPVRQSVRAVSTGIRLMPSIARSANGRAAGANKAAQRAAMKKRRIKAHRRHSRG